MVKYYLRALAEGKEVDFDVVQGKKGGPEAANVTSLNGTGERGNAQAALILLRRLVATEHSGTSSRYRVRLLKTVDRRGLASIRDKHEGGKEREAETSVDGEGRERRRRQTEGNNHSAKEGNVSGSGGNEGRRRNRRRSQGQPGERRRKDAEDYKKDGKVEKNGEEAAAKQEGERHAEKEDGTADEKGSEGKTREESKSEKNEKAVGAIVLRTDRKEMMVLVEVSGSSTEQSGNVEVERRIVEKDGSDKPGGSGRHHKYWKGQQAMKPLIEKACRPLEKELDKEDKEAAGDFKSDSTNYNDNPEQVEEGFGETRKNNPERLGSKVNALPVKQVVGARRRACYRGQRRRMGTEGETSDCKLGATQTAEKANEQPSRSGSAIITPLISETDWSEYGIVRFVNI
ncbi:unnamed protein product [Toxocara canis]|uniref:CSD domain-containing protein n=1 Tax=Toxocara canis TaxID=6265 RepID=A0A183VAQ0_TOXCA|nr:unnamed protein product [Toxocara canis]